MKGLFLFVLIPFVLIAQPPAPQQYSATVNIALDLAGKPDATPAAWGCSDAFASRVQFAAPAGYRTRILRIYGDFIAFPRSGIIPAGTSAEIGWGLKTTAPDGSTRVTYPGYTASAYDNSFAWQQGAVTAAQPSTRLPFDIDVHAGGLLGPDNIMLVQSFVALNTTGLTIHMEPTLTVVYQFEQVAQ
jgi:hypothetical protein